jgi:hypothetical protein
MKKKMWKKNACEKERKDVLKRGREREMSLPQISISKDKERKKY